DPSSDDSDEDNLSTSPWLDPDTCDPFNGITASQTLQRSASRAAKRLSSHAMVESEILARHVWGLRREHESLLTIAYEQAALSELALLAELRAWRRKVRSLRKLLPASSLPLSEKQTSLAHGPLAAARMEVADRNRRLGALARQVAEVQDPPAHKGASQVEPSNLAATRNSAIRMTDRSSAREPDISNSPAGSDATRLLMERAGLRRRVAALEAQLETKTAKPAAQTSNQSPTAGAPGSAVSLREELAGLRSRCHAALGTRCAGVQ
ncbi:unnamed protein product, partial [Polarella glacialis]